MDTLPRRAEESDGHHAPDWPLKPTVQRMIENPLAVRVLAGQFAAGDHILAQPNGETFTFRRESPATATS